MAYDYQKYEQKIRFANSPKGWVTKIIAGYKETFPKLIPKILIGAPLYGWRGEDAMVSSSIVSWMDENPADSTIIWQYGNQEHYFVAGDQLCAFPTPSFVLHRKELTRLLGVAGIAYWELGQTNRATLSVI
jgi:hypothetical protein